MSFLLFRPTDHFFVGVAWSGMSISGGLAGPALTAINDTARIVVTFPPQHIGEETSPDGSPAPTQVTLGSGTSVPVWRATLAGPTRLAVSIGRGTVVPLTAEGILAAIAAGTVTAPGSTPTADDTAVELPARLVVTPVPVTPGASVVCRHPAAPQAVNGTAAVWRTRFGSSPAAPTGTAGAPGATANAALGVRAVGFTDTDPGFSLPLPSADRSRIVHESGPSPALATRLELSALGGTLTVSGHWPTYEWQHECVLGRDMTVSTLARGVLYPLGHKAVFQKFTSRKYDPTAGGADVLRTLNVLTVTQPVRQAPPDGPSRRKFPFARAEILTTRVVVADADWTHHSFNGQDLPTYFWPEIIAPNTSQRAKVQFAVQCENPDAVLHFALPMIFVADLTSSNGAASLTDPALTAELARTFPQQPITLPGITVNLVASPATAAVSGAGGSNDKFELHAMSIAGVATIANASDGYRAALASMTVATPALRSLLGNDQPRLVRFAEDYLSGATNDVLLHIDPAQPIDVNFTAMADRCGALSAPRYVADAISRVTGPVKLAALPDVNGLINPGQLFQPDATILGFAMRELLPNPSPAPQITTAMTTGTAPDVTMRWKNVPLKTNGGGFVGGTNAGIDLTVTTGPSGTSTDCTVSNFSLLFPPAGAVLQLTFATIQYTQRDGQPPRLQVGSGVGVEFLGDLRLVETLKDAVDFGDPGDLSKVGQFIDVTATAIAVHYTFAAPPVGVLAFSMRNISFAARITVPYDAKPVTVELGFSSRAAPFQLSVLTFGGTGYVDVALDKTGLTRFEAALEFGAMASVDFVVARGEVHILGGVRFTLEQDRSVTVTGYLRIGGCVEVLGLVSVSVELMIELTYQSARNALVGRATLVLTIDLTLWSDTMEIDSGEWVIAGGDATHADRLFAARAFPLGAPPPPPVDGLARWVRYRQAFFDPSVPGAAPPASHRGEVST